MDQTILVNKAILESLYLWQNSEWKYYKAIQEAFENRSKEASLVQFAEQDYYRFLKEYKIRRSLPGKGTPPVVELVKDLFKNGGFAERVMQFADNQGVIDDYCEELSENEEISGGKKLLSLITKTAFLLKPKVIPLFDKYAKESLKQETKIKITNFETFYRAFQQYKKGNIEFVRENVKRYDCVFSSFDELSEFENNREFIAHRTIDKILWMKYNMQRK